MSENIEMEVEIHKEGAYMVCDMRPEGIDHTPLRILTVHLGALKGSEEMEDEIIEFAGKVARASLKTLIMMAEQQNAH